MNEVVWIYFVANDNPVRRFQDYSAADRHLLIQERAGRQPDRGVTTGIPSQRRFKIALAGAASCPATLIGSRIRS
jgi:hypothetical protein